MSTQSRPLDQLVGGSPAIAALRDRIRQLVTFDAVGSARVPPLLLEGETGTGKGLLARLVHDIGPRSAGPFVDVSCSAIPETLLEAELFGFDPGAFTDARRAKPGLFEAASGGCLFLDEVQSLPAVLQGKLLRAIEDKRVRRLGAVADREVDVKLIAATQDDLATRVAEHRFRADLYHRLAVVVLTVPPVRERGDDVLLLSEHFLRRYAQVYRLEPRRLGPDAGAWLRRYSWPGNVRELSHVMERVMLLGAQPVVSADTLARFCLRKSTVASGRRDAASGADVLDGGADDAIRVRHALERCGGNVVRAARFLGLTRSALRHRMQHHGIRRSAPGRTAIETEGQALPATEDALGRTLLRITPTTLEVKPVAVLAIELMSSGDDGERDRRHEEAFTEHRRWTDEVAGRIVGFGGALLERSPSLLLAAFGLPRALEQAPHRAVQAALTIRQAAEDAPRERTRDRPLVRLSVHLGTILSDGEAIDPTRIVAVGETLALPVRLLAHTAPGQITVTAAVARQIDGPFVLEAKTPRRGDDDEPALFRVVGPAGTRSPARHDGTRSGFVGRERDLGNLEYLLAEAEAGRGQVVGIAGDPGMGRSRLIAEFRQRIAGRASYREGRCFAYRRTEALYPVQEILRSEYGITDDDGAEAIGAKLARIVEAADLPPTDWGAVLGRIFGHTNGTERLAPRTVPARTFRGLRRLLLRTPGAGALVLAIEDLQWIDPLTEQLLDMLVESLARARVLLLTTYRSSYRPPWTEKSYVTKLALAPLAPLESWQLLHELIGTARMPDAVAQAILARAEGNPFLLEELAQSALQRGGQTVDRRVPDTVHGVLRTEIERLGEDSRHILQVASVLGREFRLRLLDTVAESRGPLAAHLARLVSLEFLYERPGSAEPTYVFKDAMTQEVAYETISPERRRTLHAAVGRALETLELAQREEHRALLAHHNGRASDQDRALEYIEQSNGQTASAYAIEPACTHFTDATETSQSEARPCIQSPTARRAPHRPSGRDDAAEGQDVPVTTGTLRNPLRRSP